MTTAEELQRVGIRSALIIDDGYDTTPTAGDMLNATWSTFFDDLVDDNEAVIRDVYPEYDALSHDELREKNDFIAILWNLRTQLPEDLLKPLFAQYDQAIRDDQQFLERLEQLLLDLGLTLAKAGRYPTDDHGQQDVYFVDLFLGAAQTDPDVSRSIEILIELLKSRRDNPPIVVLMSRSQYLEDYRESFRDRAELIGAMFRVHTKSELRQEATLVRVLSRLAMHHEDGKRIARFFYEMEIGLKQAQTNFFKATRRLDLSDYAQIQELLLNAERQPLGSYLIDVFDRVLQYEIEAHQGTITAARSLNEMDATQYPAPYIAGSSETQHLVHRTLWQNPKRLAVETTLDDIPVSFGDLLIQKSLFMQETLPASTDARRQVFVVLTAACDLMRVKDSAKSVLCMTGQILSLSPSDWSYGGALRTPILLIPDKAPMWIEWEDNNPQTFTMDELRERLLEDGDLKVALRFRESQAIEIQQRLLAKIGRVGVIAKMPATFEVEFRASYKSTDGQIVELDLPIANTCGGVCYSGRDVKGDSARLVLTTTVIEELLQAIGDLTDAQVYSHARLGLRRIKADSMLATMLEKGVKIEKDVYSDIKIETRADDGKVSFPVVGCIGWNTDESKDTAVKNNSALIIKLSNKLPQSDSESSSVTIPL